MREKGKDHEYVSLKSRGGFFEERRKGEKRRSLERRGGETTGLAGPIRNGKQLLEKKKDHNNHREERLS